MNAKNEIARQVCWFLSGDLVSDSRVRIMCMRYMLWLRYFSSVFR